MRSHVVREAQKAFHNEMRDILFLNNFMFFVIKHKKYRSSSQVFLYKFYLSKTYSAEKKNSYTCLGFKNRLHLITSNPQRVGFKGMKPHSYSFEAAFHQWGFALHA